jgi:hypothetical protein
LAVHHGHTQLFPLSCIYQHSLHKSSVQKRRARRFGSKPQSASERSRGPLRPGTVQ